MSQKIGAEFMRLTQSEHLERSPQDLGTAPQPPLELPCPPDVPRIPLPKPDKIEIPPLDVRAAIEQRVTWRQYAPQALSLPELSWLLWATQGVKRVSKRPVTLRNVPSAGARHAFETYLLINRVETLEPGVYRYLALDHALAATNLKPGMADEVTHACYDQGQVAQSAVTFLWVAVVERMTWRYVQRGYRYLHLDAGHVCQNLYLAAEAVGCGVCAIAAYDDELANTTLGLDGEAQFVIYAASLGKKQKPEH